MKTIRNISFVIYILTFVSCETKSQTGIRFKSLLIPGNVYTQSMEMTNISESKYIADQEFLDKLKEKGIRNPIISKSILKFESKSIVSALDSGKYFIVTEIMKDNSALPMGTKFFGHGQANKIPTFDSITMIPVYSNEYKEKLISTLQNVFKQIEFPDKAIKTGEEFSINNNLRIPVESDTIPLTIITTYKLLEVKDGIAKFSIKQSYDVEPNISLTTFLNGTGTGYLNFDILNKCYKEYGIKTSTFLKIRRDQFTLQTNTKTTTTIFYNVTSE